MMAKNPIIDDDIWSEPPIIDFVDLLSSPDAYMVTFIPEDQVSSSEKEMVLIARGDAEWTKFSAGVERLRLLLSDDIRTIGHAGGSGFTISRTSGPTVVLPETAGASPDPMRGVRDVLQQLAMLAQLQFLISQRLQTKIA